MPMLSSTARLSFGSSPPASMHSTFTFWAASDSATAVPPIPVPMTHTSASSRGSLSAATSTDPGLPPQQSFVLPARGRRLGVAVSTYFAKRSNCLRSRICTRDITKLGSSLAVRLARAGAALLRLADERCRQLARTAEEIALREFDAELHQRVALLFGFGLLGDDG